ncbi:hypothetical protein [Streptomyces avermitilis]|uniref:hypothetical protein n=1 Tax=Streptomyces avermitilis TaxID=33903 RepID=UPI0036A148F9
MLGEELPAVEVTERGLAHDRRLALIDRDTGKVASAPGLWRRLLTMTAQADNSAVRMTTSDGKELWSTDPGVDEALSEIVAAPCSSPTPRRTRRPLTAPPRRTSCATTRGRR